MRNFLLIMISFLFVISCTDEVNETFEASSNEPQYDYSEKIHYQGVVYEIKYKRTPDGGLETVSDIPDILSKLENLPELATVIENDEIYFFDDLKSQFEFYNLDYEAYIHSNAKGLSDDPAKANFSVSLFNDGVRAYEHDNFSGKRLHINSVNDLRNLKSVNFNDVMSSVAVWTHYPTYPFVSQPHNGDYVIFFEHSDWKGKSLAFKGDPLFTYVGGDGRQYRGHHKFRDLKMTWLSRWADKVSSIDVLIANLSIVR